MSMDAVRGSGNVDFSSSFKTTLSKQQPNALNATEGSPQQEITEFKGMSLADKIKTLSEKVSTLTKLEIKSTNSEVLTTTGNILRRDLDQFAKMNKLALSDDQSKILEDSLGGKIARRDMTKWGKNDIKATIDMTATQETVSQLEGFNKLGQLNKLEKQELAIIKTSHEILNKLFENWG